MIIGVISDTHGLLREEVKSQLQDCSLIIHAGDIGKLDVIDQLKGIGSLEIIRGNIDKSIEENSIKEDKIINVQGKRIYIIHNISKVKIDLEKENIDIVVYGHSHKSKIYVKNGIIYINPGSVGPRRFKLPITMCKLYIDEVKENIRREDMIEFKDIKVQPIELK